MRRDVIIGTIVGLLAVLLIAYCTPELAESLA